MFATLSPLLPLIGNAQCPLASALPEAEHPARLPIDGTVAAEIGAAQADKPVNLGVAGSHWRKWPPRQYPSRQRRPPLLLPAFAFPN